MTVGSFIELYTTLIGWAFYNNVWAVLTGTGIVFLPFIGMVIDNFSRADSAAEAVQRMEIEIALVLSVIVLAAQPVYPLAPTSLEYHPPCDKNQRIATVGNTGTTYDATLGARDTVVTGIQQAINVPLWWYGVMAFAGGTNHALIGGLRCVADLRAVDQAARAASFENQGVRREYDRFASECFLPALSKYNREQPDSDAIQAILDIDAADPTWIGSRLFRQTPGYYDVFRAATPMPGYPYVPARDTEYDSTLPPPHGRPTCKEWWEGSAGGPAGGLRQKLIDEAGYFEQAKELLASQLGSVFWSDYELESLGDAIIKDLQTQGPPDFTGTSYGGSAAPATGAAVGIGGGAVGGGLAAALVGTPIGTAAAVGGGLAAGAMAVKLAADLVGYYTTMFLVREAAPIVQALILMAIYAFLPFLIVFSSYSLKTAVMGAIGILAVKFWSVLWMLAWWLDQYLLAAMYPDAGTFFGPGSLSLDTVLLDMVIVALYIGLPVLFTVVMGWGGLQVGNGISATAEKLSGQPSQIGGAAAGSGTQAGGSKTMGAFGNKRN